MGSARTGSRSLSCSLDPITGAGGATGIEGGCVRGAHGPRRLHIVPVEG